MWIEMIERERLLHPRSRHLLNPLIMVSLLIIPHRDGLRTMMILELRVRGAIDSIVDYYR
jgi:hypothetical protein